MHFAGRNSTIFDDYYSDEEDADIAIPDGINLDTDFVTSSESSDSENEELIVDMNMVGEDCEEFTDSDGDDEESDTEKSTERDPDTFIATPPFVLEPYHIISKVSGNKFRHVGYRLCGDNIDKTIRSRYLRSDHRNISMHYFHSYAVQNRVDFSHLSDKIMVSHFPNPEEIALSVLPSSRDDISLRSNLAVLVSRVLVDHLKYFNVTFQDVTQRHIEHQFYQEMSQKSVVVKLYIKCYLA